MRRFARRPLKIELWFVLQGKLVSRRYGLTLTTQESCWNASLTVPLDGVNSIHFGDIRRQSVLICWSEDISFSYCCFQLHYC